ncbi:hypothetical protein MRX96_044157 [Rhipicephalus microplus]
MAASVAMLETVPHDCCGADEHTARLLTLRTFSGYAIYPVARHEECRYGHLSATSGSSDAVVVTSGDPDANILIRQKQHHKRAFYSISKALKRDEENDNLKKLAIGLYRKDIDELEKGIAIDFSY